MIRSGLLEEKDCLTNRYPEGKISEFSKSSIFWEVGGNVEGFNTKS